MALCAFRQCVQLKTIFTPAAVKRTVNNMYKKTVTALKLIGIILLLSLLTSAAFGQTKRTTLVFSGIANPDSLDNYQNFYRAVIFVHDTQTWRMIYLPEQYDNAFWEYAARSKKKTQVWAIAQFGRGDIGPDLEIARSIDDGRKWTHYSLVKVSRFARYHSFAMSANGKGTLTIHLEDSPDSEHRDGYYTYATTNGGAAWSKKPVYSATAPVEAGNNSIESIPVQCGLNGTDCTNGETPRN